MRSVTVWACSCGVQYKAICEIDRKSSPAKQTSVICPKCQAVMKLDGVVSSCPLWSLWGLRGVVGSGGGAGPGVGGSQFVGSAVGCGDVDLSGVGVVADVPASFVDEDVVVAAEQDEVVHVGDAGGVPAV